MDKIIQRLMIRSCGPVYMDFVIDWETYKTYFCVSCSGYEEHLDSAKEAEERFDSIVRQTT